MSEIENDFHGSPEQNKKAREPAKEANSQHQDKSLPEPPGSDSPEGDVQDCKDSHSIPPVDNSSFEQLFVQKLYGAKYDLPNDGVKSDDPAPRSTLDNQPEKTLPSIDLTYFDLIKENRRDQVTLAQEDVDHDLVGALAENLNNRDQFSTPVVEEIAQESLRQDQFVHLHHSQKSQIPGFWTRAAMPGSAMVLAIVVVSGVFVKSRGIPAVFEENPRIAQVASLIGLKSTTSIGAKPIDEVSLTDGQQSSEAVNMTEFVPPPVLPDASDAAKQAQDKQRDVERTVKIDKLNTKLKIVRAYQSSRQRAYDVAGLEKKPDLLDEVTTIQAETSSLEQKIASLQPSQSVVQTTTGAASGKSRDDIKPTVATAATPVVIPKTRSRETVELAMASAPGLYLLEPDKRSRLKAKLVNGDCLVPALSSVFPQVPALVMRDLVRQFEGQC